MVARSESVHLLIAVSAFKHLRIRQWDFSAAYLNGQLPQEPRVYMYQPTGFAVKGEEDKVCLMHKPLYGMTQAGHIWYKDLEDQFQKLGFKSSRADPCIRFRHDESTGKYSIASVHTDDVFSRSNDDSEADDMVKGFSIWDLKDVKDKRFLVGLSIDYLSDSSIGISQAPFFYNAFRYFNILDKLLPISTPLPPNFSLSPDQVQTDDDREFMKDKPFRGILGCCWWGGSNTRPDIVFSCSTLSSIQNSPTKFHWDLLIKLCGYILFTIRYGIVYRPGTTERIKPIGYVDADLAGDKVTRKSMSGYIFLVNGSPVSWSSKRQSMVALSSTESEYISLSRGVQQAVWIRSWLDEIGLGLGENPIDILCDNIGAVSLAETNKAHNLSKHIDIRLHFIRDIVGKGDIAVYPVSSMQNLADIMTKSLSKFNHSRIISALGLDWSYQKQDARGSVESDV
jgi:hypothetical protein